MDGVFLDSRLTRIFDKVKNNIRLDFEDGRILYETTDLMGAGQIAGFKRKKLHGDSSFFIYNQHLNYTNICRNKCLFCAYAKDYCSNGSYQYTMEDVYDEIMKRIDEPVREIHMVGGLNESLPYNYYIDLLKTIKKARPDVTIKAFTAVEIDHLSKISSMSVEDVVKDLAENGLEMMPGGGAEVLSDRVRKKLFPRKINKDRWLEIIEKVHNSKIPTNCTMLYGHIETVEEKLNHFIYLRQLQDRTNGFTAFIPLAFHSKNTKLSHIRETTAFEDLKNIIVARLMLDNIPHIKAYWVMLGEKLAQTALHFGADDLDGTILEEKITHSAGAESAVGHAKETMINLIENAGLKAVERDAFYNEVE
ncbi:MAG: aminofutalosine synthase MqnE [Deltaproteobacteria bacterium]|nr:MAG: aminofutalosine synthase MqnE [Deltaproteobacteria bacterium]